MGLFRNGSSIFTTNFLNFNDTFYNTHWLRINLKNFELSKKQKENFSKNSKFRVEINPLELNVEKEDLFKRYKEATPFIRSQNLQMLLFDGDKRNIYDSWEVCIYDGDELIGLGVFDNGANTAAGITSVYDPRYTKNSLGKYLILQKMVYCKKIDKEWFYPGYFTTVYKAFDYKLDLCRSHTEYYNFMLGMWNSYEIFDATNEPLRVIEKKLNFIKEIFSKVNLKTSIKKYNYFDSNLYLKYGDVTPLTDPYYLQMDSLKIETIGNIHATKEIIRYNVVTKHYEVIIIHPIFQVINPDIINTDGDEENVYGLVNSKKIEKKDAYELVKFYIQMFSN
jgi:leucyl-tRNA---protein transferase